MLPVYLIHYNKPEWVDSAAATFVGYDVTVVHNGGELPQTPVRHTGKNGGYTGGANFGLREWLQGSEPFVLIASHDCHAAPGAVDKLVTAAQAHSDFGILTFEMPDAQTSEEHLGTVDGIDEREWVSGQAMLLRREMVEQVGLLDESFRSYVEDVEYGHRARRHGWRVGVVQGALGHGLGSGDSEVAGLAIPANLLLLHFKLRHWRTLLGTTRHLLARAGRGEARLMLRILSLGYGRILLSPCRRTSWPESRGRHPRTS